MSKELIRLTDLVMTFDDEVVLDHINLYINDHEFLTLLGPSGCGKTTTLRIIGGFQTPTSGDVFFDGVRINSVPPHQRKVNTVFQKYALFPHLDVYENVAFGLRVSKAYTEQQIDGKVVEMLELVGLRVIIHQTHRVFNFLFELLVSHFLDGFHFMYFLSCSYRAGFLCFPHIHIIRLLGLFVNDHL